MTEPVWIAHHDVHRKALRYDRSTGAFEHRSRVEAPSFIRGFYVELAEGVAGLYASPEGPYFFRDDRRIPIASVVTASVARGHDHNTFRLETHTANLELDYRPPTDIGVGDFSTESDRDFFVWLAESVDDPQLVHFFTQELPTPG